MSSASDKTPRKLSEAESKAMAYRELDLHDSFKGSDIGGGAGPQDIFNH